jgi:hypothetical protein
MLSAPSAMKEYSAVAVHTRLGIKLMQEHPITNAKNVRLSGSNWDISLFL